jgi:TadE-like protein
MRSCGDEHHKEENEMHQWMSRFFKQLKRFHQNVEGQDLLEWTMGLPVFMVLCAGIAFFFWLWWNQVSAAAAVHDATYFAAVKGGDVGAGLARANEMLGAAVGAFHKEYAIALVYDPRKSVSGEVSANKLFQLPFLGPLPFTAEAHSFQRLENFYGGPPGHAGAAFWWW